MWKRVKQVIFLALLGTAGYFLLTYHFVFFGRTIRVLKKLTPTSEYTIVNTAGTGPDAILKIDPLRKAGVGKLLVEMGTISEAEKDRLEKEFEDDPIAY